MNIEFIKNFVRCYLNKLIFEIIQIIYKIRKIECSINIEIDYNEIMKCDLYNLIRTLELPVRLKIINH